MQQEISGVLHLDDAGELLLRDQALGALDGSQQPLHEVQGVDRLVDQQAAARVSPSARARAWRRSTPPIVTRRPMPRRPAPHRARRPRAVGTAPGWRGCSGSGSRSRSSGRRCRRRPAARGRGAEGLHQARRLLEGMGERLLLQHVHTPLQRGERRADVLVVRSGDVHGVSRASISSSAEANVGRPVAASARARPAGSVSAMPISSRPSIASIAPTWTTDTSPYPISPIRRWAMCCASSPLRCG